METTTRNKKDNILAALRKIDVALNVHITIERAAIYANYLADIPGELFDRTVDEIIKTYNKGWFPRISDIRDKAARIHLKIDSVPSKERAWSIVFTYLTEGTEKTYESLLSKIKNPIFKEFLTAYGKSNIISIARSADDNRYERKFFIDAYQNFITAQIEKLVKEGGWANDNA